MSGRPSGAASGAIGLGIVLLAFVVAVASLVWHPLSAFTQRANNGSSILWLLTIAFVSGAYLALSGRNQFWLKKIDSEWPWFATVAVIACTVSIAAFVEICGHRELGTWDFGIMLDTGWRELQGELPYSGFVTPNPPLFNLGVLYSYRIFGVSWNGPLHSLALLAAGTFLWHFWLLRKLKLPVFLAILSAFTIQMVSTVLLSFWWYNNTVAVIAAGFLFTCAVILQGSTESRIWVSYVVSLAALGLSKPNIAGLVIVFGVAALLMCGRERKKLLLHTAVAVGIAILVLVVHGISVTDMLQSYRGAARERGGLSTFGMQIVVGKVRRGMLILWVLLLASPLLLQVLPYGRGSTFLKDRRRLGVAVLMLGALVTSCYGILTDGEFKDLEWVTLIAMGCVIVFPANGFGPISAPRNYQRAFAALLIGLSLVDAYEAYRRDRVRAIGIQYFSGGGDAPLFPLPSPFFSGMHASAAAVEAIRALETVPLGDHQRVFFGPRLEFAYPMLGVRSPDHLPIYWQPGTSFSRSSEGHLEDVWQQKHFETLVFVKGEYIFYSDHFRSMILANYVADESRPAITVWTRR